MWIARLFRLLPAIRRGIGRLLDLAAGVDQGPLHLVLPSGAGLWLAEVIWRAGEVTLDGRHTADALRLGFEGDAGRELPAGPFHLTWPRPAPGAVLQLTGRVGEETVPHLLVPPDDRALRRARRRALPGVIWRLGREVPALLAYLRHSDPALALALRNRLGLGDQRHFLPLPTRLFVESQPPPPPRHLPAVIVPVFNARDDLARLLTRLETGVGCEHYLILVDDGSDDPALHADLAGHAAHHPGRCHLLRFESSRGFVAAANAGIETARKLTRGHVVLLNSDTLPPEAWLPRLLAPFASDRRIASITPLSNAAELLSIPGPPTPPMPAPRQVDRIDQVAQHLAPGIARADLPTGVGFCLALNRRFLDRLGGFDPAFGRGYGEEVDWCQRAERAGGRNIALASLFVGHRGGASFRPEERALRLRAAGAEIARRHPEYDRRVRDWGRADPLGPARLILGLAWLGAVAPRPVPVFLGHSLGGGAETALKAEIASELSAGAPGLVVIRVGGPRPWRLELHHGEACLGGDLSETAQLLELTGLLGRIRLIYSCGVGAQDPAAVPRLLNRLSARAVRTEMRLHDFFPVSPSWNLLAADGTFRGLPDPETEDPAHQIAAPARLSHGEWRALWAEVITASDRIRVFSPSSAALLTAAYPEAQPKIRQRPHRLPHRPAPLAPGGRAIGILGSLNQPKGAGVVCAIGAVLKHRRLVVLGEMDSRFTLPPPHRVHGGYAPAEIEDLARRHDIGLWLIPSICPETFSFATHEALATGLPVLGFNLGAQGDALRAAPNGHLLRPAPDEAEALAQAICTHLDATTTDPKRATGATGHP